MSMKIEVIGNGSHRVCDNMLIFNTNQGQIELSTESAKQIVWTLLDSLYFTDCEMNEILDEIEDKIYKRGDL